MFRTGHKDQGGTQGFQKVQGEGIHVQEPGEESLRGGGGVTWGVLHQSQLKGGVVVARNCELYYSLIPIYNAFYIEYICKNQRQRHSRYTI